MGVPLLVAGLGGLALSAGANLYAQKNSRALYRRQIDAYRTLQNGYARHLAKYGRRLNPARAYERWGSKIDSADTNYRNAYAHSVGTVAGSFGAGVMTGRRAISRPRRRFNPTMTYRWL